ncbi:hypothetical protein FACS189472_18340 [Alphaproteobacteria bacterium]|nr:hypothetical protein FACS189472_18340 [Alphaproteobacteria bacterium]
MFRKRRRNFSALAKFIGYEGGNVVCELLQAIPLLTKTRANPQGLTSMIVLPIFYTKIIAKSADEIPVV